MTALPQRPSRLASTVAALAIGASAFADDGSPKIKFGGSWRARVETSDWFDSHAQFDDEYTFIASLLKGNVTVATRGMEFMVEVSQTTLINLPDNAAVPAPEGQLGNGAAYYAGNNGQDGTVGLHQAFVRFRNVFSGHSTLRLGRFEYSEAADATPKDETLAWLKQKRIAERLLSTFFFTHVQTALDGVQYVWDSPWLNVDLVAARPTEGALKLRSWDELDLDILYGSLTTPLPNAQARLFALHTTDRRDAVKADNRPLAARAADHGDVSVTTVGANFIGAWDVGIGKADVAAWGCIQRGEWGALDQRAWAATVEAGWQFPHLPWRPWLRFGWSHATGDADPADGVHGTFFPHFPARLYARFPVYSNPMNNQDLFVQLLLRPAKQLEVRIDAHRIDLSETADAWYSGGYAFRDSAFGYTARPSNGHTHLSNLLDISLDYKPTPQTRLTFYAGYAFGGDVTRAIYAKNSAAFVYWEFAHTF